MPYHRLPLIRGLTDWLATPEATRPAPAWSTDPALSGFSSPAEAASRAAADPAAFAVLAARPGDHMATAAALAVVADQLAPVAARWYRSGLRDDDLADAEADLVTEALTAMRADPSRPAAVVVQIAWHRVEAIRRTARARGGRHEPLSPGHDRVMSPAEPVLRPLGVIGDAVATGVLTTAVAAVLWSECGLPVLDRASVSPAAWRQRRSRARRALRAALGPAGGL